MPTEVPYKAVVNIENIVATVTLEQQLDLYAMERSVPNVEYDPDQFPGLIFRLESPKVTSLIFKSGKMVVTGAKSTEELIKSVKRIIKTLKKYGMQLTGKPKIQIQNIVASANLHVIVNLDKAAFLLENNMYEPEQFPGLIYRMDDPRVVLLVFSSGKMVITGAKREEEVHRAVKKIFDKLVELDCVRPVEEEEIEF
ncbi:MAG: TATA-box-binding protein [Sulfolobus sp.]